LTRTISPVKTRQNLAPGQIAGAAKDDKIEGVDRDNTRNH